MAMPRDSYVFATIRLFLVGGFLIVLLGVSFVLHQNKGPQWKVPQRPNYNVQYRTNTRDDARLRNTSAYQRYQASQSQ